MLCNIAFIYVYIYDVRISATVVLREHNRVVTETYVQILKQNHSGLESTTWPIYFLNLFKYYIIQGLYNCKRSFV